MRVPHGVDADGDLNRYLQECMLVHDEWVIVWPNWVVPQKQYKLLSLFRDGERTKAFFFCYGGGFQPTFLSSAAGMSGKAIMRNAAKGNIVRRKKKRRKEGAYE